VYETFDFRVDGLGNAPDLFQGQFPLQDQPPEAQAFQPAGFLDGSDGALGGGVHDEVSAHAENGGVLDDEGIYAGLFQGADHFLCAGALLLLEERIDGGEDAHAEAVGIFAELPDILDAVSGGVPGAEGRSGNINGIGPAVNGCQADVFSSGWSQQFQRFQGITGS
jgi:hypothetical protein